MHKRLVHLAIIIGAIAHCASAADKSPQTDWFKEARIGAFMHFLPGNAEQFAKVNDFDVEALARQLEDMGAKYFVFTLGQNSGWFNAPNATYDRVTGYQPGERCATRDLPLDLYRALHAKGIRLMLYLPCQTPNARHPRAESLRPAAGPEGPADRPRVREAVGRGHPRVVGALWRQGVRLVVRWRL